MSNNLKLITAPLAAMATFGLMHSAHSLSAQSEADQQKATEGTTDLTDARCRDIMILSGLDRDVTIAFLHGFLVGKSGETKINSDKLTDSTEIFLNTCLDKPDAKALKVLEETLIK